MYSFQSALERSFVMGEDMTFSPSATLRSLGLCIHGAIYEATRGSPQMRYLSLAITTTEEMKDIVLKTNTLYIDRANDLDV